MIAIDTGPIVALFDKEDDKHALCTKIFKEIHEPLVTSWPVLTEAFYLLSFSPTVRDDLWEFIERGIVTVYNLNTNLFSTCRALMKQYHNLPMDLADATLIAVAEAEDIRTVFTLDHKDFKVYKPQHKKHFKLLPSEL